MKEVIDKLSKEIILDEGYRRTWQANIAMAFFDEYRRKFPLTFPSELHEIANEAANNFLRSLTNGKFEVLK